jgi:hypothetical protein
MMGAIQAIGLVSELLNAGINMLIAANQVSALITQAQKEGRDLTKEELEAVVKGNDVAIKALEEALK